EVVARVRALAENPSGWRDWANFRTLCREAGASIAAPLLAEAESGRLHWGDMPRAFERRFLERWLDARAEESEILRRFKGASHEERIAEFRELDRNILKHHREALVAQLREQA